MKQEIKNMEQVLEKLKESLIRCYFDEAKTLSNVYERMVLPFRYLSTVDYHKDEVGLDLIKQLETVKLIQNEINSILIPKCLDKNEFKALHQLQIANEKLLGVIGSLGKSLNKYKAAFEITDFLNDSRPIFEKKDYISKLLDLSIKTRTLIALFDESNRGVGKTTALVKKASELGCVLLVDIPSRKDYASKIANDMDLNVLIITPRSHSLAQYQSILKTTGYLIDETIDDNTLSTFNKSGYKLLGGFKRIVI